MMKIYFFLTFLVITGGYNTTFAQVGIGTINPQGAFHVDASKNNTSSGLPVPSLQRDDVIILSNGKLGIGNITPSVRLDARAADGSNSAIAIGNTTATASEAGAGAMRYYNVSGGLLQISDGVKWGNLLSSPKKSFVAAHIVADNGTITFGTTPKDISSWTTVKDVNEDFNSTTGVFTARRDGVYNVNFTYDFVQGSIATGSHVEAQFVKNTSEIIIKCLKSFGKSTRDAQAGGICNSTVELKKDETLNVKLLQTVSTTERGLRSTISVDNGFYGFNNISIIEL